MLPPNSTIEFIQGYQDKKILYDRLPIIGKINVDTKNYSKKDLPFKKYSHEHIYQYIYTPNNIDNAIRKHPHAAEANSLCEV